MGNGVVRTILQHIRCGLFEALTCYNIGNRGVRTPRGSLGVITDQAFSETEEDVLL